MKRRGVFLVVLLLVLISLISVVYAASTTYTYPGLTNVNAVVYQKSDNTKVETDYSSGTGNTITINYPGSSQSTDFYTYHYKQNYLPVSLTYNNPIGISLNKQSSCKSQILSVNAPSSANKNEQFTITVNLNDITSVFPNLVLPTFIPSELSEYYKADTNVKLYIDNNPIETKQIKISTTGNNLQFTPSISTTGPHNINIETEVTDNQCSSYLNPQQSLATITINPSTSTQVCTSSDWSYTAWSPCTNSQQTRTVTKTTTCDGNTGKPAETQSCYQCSDAYDNDNDAKLDYPTDLGCSSLTDNDETDIEACPQTGQTCPNKAYEKCPTGHPRCSCTGTTELKAYLCSSTQTCTGTSLTHSDPALGTCCSTQCTEKKEICTPEGKTELCPPDLNGCAMSKTCKSGYWTDCARMDTGCVKAPSCIDGTPSGRCSNQSIGRLCFDGALSNHATCLTTPCTENWYCETFSSPCIGGYKTCVSGYIDINKCNTTINKPITQQPCAYQNSATEEEFNLKLKSTEGDLESSRGEEGSAIGSTSTQSALNKLLSIPKNFNLTIGFETPFVLLLISLFFITIAVYYMSKRQKLPKVKEKPKNIKKEETHSVKVNDLLLSVVESLEGDERRVVDKLIEVEGTRIDKLREILGMNKTKLEIALSKLEKRQIIKERTDDNSKLFFNDWLK